MDRAAHPALWRGAARAAARRRDRPLEARLSHPIFEAVRPWLERLQGSPSLKLLNFFSEEQNLRTESGKAVRFVEPKPSNPYYEVHLFESGEVNTRPENNHDLFNALVWLAFPKTKARINALHAREIPKEGGKRGRLRDLLTIFDEGGAVVVGDGESERLVRASRWQDLFVQNPKFKLVVLGHAVLEQALNPYPGITCKVMFARPGADLDAHCAEWLATRGTSPRDLPPVPVMGYPGWYAGNEQPGFLADRRYFRETPGIKRQRCGAVKSRPGAGQAAAGPKGSEESPGSAEQDAG